MAAAKDAANQAKKPASSQALLVAANQESRPSVTARESIGAATVGSGLSVMLNKLTFGLFQQEEKKSAVLEAVRKE